MTNSDTPQGTAWRAVPGRRRLGRYATVVFAKWKAAGFVGAIGAAVGVLLGIFNKPLPWWAWFLIVVAAILTAQYQAFGDVMNELDQEKETVLARERALAEAGRAEPSPTAVLSQLISHGEAIVDSLLKRKSSDPGEGDAEALQPAIEAWAERCRAVLQEHWPAEVGNFDAKSDKAFADTFFFGTRTARLLGFVRPRLGNLKAILIRVS